MRDDAAVERRLEYEARTLVKVIKTGEPVVNVAKVEITWQYPDDLEHSGHLIVRMPGDVDPWITAEEAAWSYLESLGELDYSSIDDIYAV